jgi:Asp-tRNA(Asn)/Glu-tRNA(Gln) amidotransferase A subunit family amidase
VSGCGRSPATKLPVGMQLIGPAHSEAALLQIAIDYQSRHPYFAEAPEL